MCLKYVVSFPHGVDTAAESRLCVLVSTTASRHASHSASLLTSAPGWEDNLLSSGSEGEHTCTRHPDKHTLLLGVLLQYISSSSLSSCMICLPNTCLECGGGCAPPFPPSPRGCSAVNGGIICQLWQCLEAASERYKEATDKESIRRAVNCLQSPGAGEYLKSMGLKTD